MIHDVNGTELELEVARMGHFALIDTGNRLCALLPIVGWGGECGSTDHPHSEMVGYLADPNGDGIYCAEGHSRFAGYEIRLSARN